MKMISQCDMHGCIDCLTYSEELWFRNIEALLPKVCVYCCNFKGFNNYYPKEEVDKNE